MRWVACVAASLCIGCSSAPPPAAPARAYRPPDERLVFFGPGAAEMRSAEAFFSLGYVTAQLDANRALHVLLIGHADRRSGDGVEVVDMAWRRARAVRTALLAHGVGAERILLGVPRTPKQDVPPNLARRVEVYVYDPVQDEASQRLGFEVELRKE
jgi:hypothetical protein